MIHRNCLTLMEIILKLFYFVIIIVFFIKKLKPFLEISFSKFFYLIKIKKEADNTQNSNSLKRFLTT